MTIHVSLDEQKDRLLNTMGQSLPAIPLIDFQKHKDTLLESK